MAKTMAETLYTTQATSTGGGRDGHVANPEGTVDLDLRPPEDLGGPGGAANPEQLFAAGYSACFSSAVALVARQQKLKIDSPTVTATVHLHPRDPGFQLSVDLLVELSGVDQQQADELVKMADEVCPYSHATRGNITVTHTAQVT